MGAAIGMAPGGSRTGLLSLGTAGQVAVVAALPARDPRLQTFAAVTGGASLVVGAILAGGFALEWLAGAVGATHAHVLLDEAAQVPAGSEGVLFVPHLNGARTPMSDPHARGAFVGLGATHTRGHLARAVVEGVAFALRSCLDVLRELGLGPADLVCAGGPVLHPLWQRTLADVLRCPLAVTRHEHLSALGAALLGMHTVGVYPAEPASVLAEAQRVEPDEAGAQRYDRLFGIYKDVYPTLQSISWRLAHAETWQASDATS
jgi:xylulokinase